MIPNLDPTDFNGIISSGKSRPSRITGASHDKLVEVVAKFSAGCERGINALAMECVAACLAADLGLPVPKPYLVIVSPEWAAAIEDASYRDLVQRSSAIGYGSTVVPSGFGVWHAGEQINETLLPVALAVFVFDAMISNPDRRPENPNCLAKGDDIRIIDHELAFSHTLVLGWKPPWKLGALQHLESPDRHIFTRGLKGREINFDVIKSSWRGISNERLKEYRATIPEGWEAAIESVDHALALIREVRDNIDGCLGEVARVLR